MKNQKLIRIDYRYVILVNNYMYKDYASIKELKRGVERLNDRVHNSKFKYDYRLIKVKITTEEIENINEGEI